MPLSTLQVGLLFGGRSGEHEISLRSARCVLDALDRSRHAATLIGIDRAGRWHVLDEAAFRRLTDTPLAALDGTGDEVVLAPVAGTRQLIDPRRGIAIGAALDVVFPLLHGTYGEDGTIQGLLELTELPFVGAGVLGSAVGMDKDVQKRLLQAAGIPVAPFLTVTRAQWQADRRGVAARASALALPLFVKPANLGSSVGISKVKAFTELEGAVEAALAYDNKLVIEQGLEAREIECGVLGNEEPQASLPGEICPRAEFYSYEAKYVDADGVELRVPAPLPPEQIAAVQELALRVFRLLECAGMARVDFFLERGSGRLYVNEINTIPGFTTASMYPKLWEVSGVPYPALIDRLIALAIERHGQRRRLNRTYVPGPP